jgi:hypothetical protein
MIMKYKQKAPTQFVEAFQLAGSLVGASCVGRARNAAAGDYVVNYADGRSALLWKDDFEEKYEAYTAPTFSAGPEPEAGVKYIVQYFHGNAWKRSLNQTASKDFDTMADAVTAKAHVERLFGLYYNYRIVRVREVSDVVG